MCLYLFLKGRGVTAMSGYRVLRKASPLGFLKSGWCYRNGVLKQPSAVLSRSHQPGESFESINRKHFYPYASCDLLNGRSDFNEGFRSFTEGEALLKNTDFSQKHHALAVGRSPSHSCIKDVSNFPHASLLRSLSRERAQQSLSGLHLVEGRRVFSSSSSSTPLNPLVGKFLAYAALLVGCALATYYTFPNPTRHDLQAPPEEHVVTNWSGTHEARTKVYLQPESLEELEAVVKEANEKKQKIRPVGSGLSPNGIGLCEDGMVNMALMDQILDIDKETNRVTVQAGARVEQVVEALRPHGLTLQNFASIKEQQIGGFIQVGAHGTGATLPPVDEQVVSLKLVTPAKGTLSLSAQSNPELFYLARCGLGAIGVVAEVTLQCVPIQKLVEFTFVTNKREVQKKHKKWLQENKHLRYMWIPDTDAVVVVKCNPLPEHKEPPKFKSRYIMEERLEPMRSLYKEISSESSITKKRDRYGSSQPPSEAELHSGTAPRSKEAESAITKNSDGNGSSQPPAEAGLLSVKTAESKEAVEALSDPDLSELSFTEVRDKLLALDPLNREHVIRVNKAEAEFWKRSEGYRVGWSDEILGFDCGGQQWVSEICFPAGTLKKPNQKDISYLERLQELIKKEGIPAPAPIEQRWTASSRSPMSPAFNSEPDALFSWVGIIMYLPTTDDRQRAAISKKFFEYRQATQQQLWDPYTAYEHWAKIEVPEDEESLAWLRDRLRKRFPVEAFNRTRSELDPNNILTNDVMDKLFPL